MAERVIEKSKKVTITGARQLDLQDLEECRENPRGVLIKLGKSYSYCKNIMNVLAWDADKIPRGSFINRENAAGSFTGPNKIPRQPFVSCKNVARVVIKFREPCYSIRV